MAIQKWLMFILLGCCAQLTWSGKIQGSVLRVNDGDTLTILTKNKLWLKVRLLEIDAPERGQAFGNKSKQSLARVCAKQQATVFFDKQDKYGRILGRVFCNKIDANRWQVAQGMAWVYDQYVNDHSLYQLQKKARDKKIGLWRDKKPTAPWVYRHNSPRHFYH